jgi:uncharacterized protein with GYD domain
VAETLASTPVEEELTMPRFLFEAAYTVEGVKGLQRGGGSSRRDAIAALAEAVGGRLETLYFAFGERDVYVILELPDNETAAAVALAVNASGATSVRTVVLLSAEQVDAAAQRSIDYRPPGA